MTSTFKLTSAEFKKIFKRPSIFVMAILLVITILVSIPIFQPANLVDTTVVYDNAQTSQDFYSNFYDELNINSKKSFDDGFAITDEMIAYYKALNTNTNLLTNYYNDVIETMNKMINETNSSIKNEFRSELVTHVDHFRTAYKTLDSLKEYEKVTTIPLTKFEYNGYDTPSNYYIREACASLEQLYFYASDNSKTTNELINSYQVNNIEEGLGSVLNNGIDFVRTTIYGLAKDFNDFFNEYVALVGGRNKIEQLKSHRANLLQVAKTLDNYLTDLVSMEYPIIIISNDDYLNINQKLDDAIVTLNISNIQDNNLNNHNDIKIALESSRIYSVLENISKTSSVTNESTIQQVHLKISEVNNLEEIQTKVNENKSSIISQIDELKNDETITNIQKEVTNYSLLESSYNSVIIDKIYLNITDNHDVSEYTNYYGTIYKDFNKYQYRERIATNEYYIENNSYSNSYLTNFSYSQNTSTKTNVYDFMYFTMELCTVIIIVFAMMLVCNLITGETESGTIKLLLVRPYKRSKIITAKLLATIFFVLTFMSFSSIITFVGGYVLYGGANASVLAVLNSSKVFTISPILLMLINIFTLSLDVIFFVLLALMISILCKNYAASISGSLVLLILNYALNILFGGAFWYTLLPGMNLHLFKYFGNAFTSTIAGTNSIAGVIQSLLITGIDTSMSFPYSIFITAVYSIVFLAVSYSVFQKRDF